MSDTEYYAIVANELANSQLDQAIWLQAKALHPDNATAAQAFYVRTRVDALKREKVSSSIQKAKETVGHSVERARRTGRNIATNIGIGIIVFASVAILVAVFKAIFGK